MSRRAWFIIEIIVVALAILVWNWFVTPSDYTFGYKRVPQSIIPGMLGIGTFLIAAIALYLVNWVHAVNEWDRRPVLRFGKYIKEVGPGLAFVEPLFYTTLEDIPVQDVVKEVKIPHVQTKDNVNVDITALLTYRVTDVRKAVVEVEDVRSAVPNRAITTANDIASGVDLTHLLESRAQFGTDVVKEVGVRVNSWGVSVKALEIQALNINDKEVAQAIAMKARAQKEADAELTRANMQLQIAGALDKAAKAYTPEGRWLKGMEVLVELCRSANNNTMLIPTDLQSAIAPLATALAAAQASSSVPKGNEK